MLFKTMWGVGGWGIVCRSENIVNQTFLYSFSYSKYTRCINVYVYIQQRFIFPSPTQTSTNTTAWTLDKYGTNAHDAFFYVEVSQNKLVLFYQRAMLKVLTNCLIKLP